MKPLILIVAGLTALPVAAPAEQGLFSKTPGNHSVQEKPAAHKSTPLSPGSESTAGAARQREIRCDREVSIVNRYGLETGRRCADSGNGFPAWGASVQPDPPRADPARR